MEKLNRIVFSHEFSFPCCIYNIIERGVKKYINWLSLIDFFYLNSRYKFVRLPKCARLCRQVATITNASLSIFFMKNEIEILWKSDLKQYACCICKKKNSKQLIIHILKDSLLVIAVKLDLLFVTDLGILDWSHV